MDKVIKDLTDKVKDHPLDIKSTEIHSMYFILEELDINSAH